MSIYGFTCTARCDLAKLPPQIVRREKILAINFKYLGDVAICTTALKALHHQVPHAEIHALVTSEAVPVLNSIPWIKRVWGLLRGRGYNALKNDLKIIRQLRAEQFDKSVDFEGNDRGAIVSCLIGATNSLGQVFQRGPKWRNWCYDTTVESLDTNRHETVRYCHLLQPWGITLPEDLTGVIHHNPVFTKQVPKNIRDSIIVHCTASKQKKEWGSFHLAELHNIARENNVKLTFSAGPSARERSYLDTLKSEIAGAEFMPPNDSLDQFISVLAQCKAVISMDTSILHIAAGLGKPTVGIFGPTSSDRWAPLNSNHASVQGHHCICSGHNESCGLQERCIDTIQPRQIWDALSTVCH